MLARRVSWMFMIVFVLACLPLTAADSAQPEAVIQLDPPTSIANIVGQVRLGSGQTIALAPAPAAPAVQPGAVAPTAADAPIIGMTIEGITYEDNEANNNDTASIPPDPHGTVGPNHVVHVVNTSIEWHTRTGVQQNSQSLRSFFAPLTPLTRTFDPKVIYDQYAGRFVVVTLEVTRIQRGDAANTSRILLAVSDDADPNGTWFFAAINGATTIGSVSTWADYPGFAVDSQAVYITANIFNFVNPGTALGSRLWIVNKSPFYNGGAISVNQYDPYATVGEFFTTTQPAHMFGTPPGNLATYLVSYSGYNQGSNSLFRAIRISDPLGTPDFTYDEISLGVIDSFFFNELPDAPQPDGIRPIDTGDRRTLQAVWRNNQLYATFHVRPPGGVNAGQTTAHWVQINTADLDNPALTDQGDIGGEELAAGTSTYYPAIMVNRDGNIAVGFSASASTLFAGAYVALREPGDPAGTMSAPATIAAGLDTYLRTFSSSPSARNRWGDYSGAALDPNDEIQFWIFNQYALPSGPPDANDETGLWGTRFGMIGQPKLTITPAAATISEADGELAATISRNSNFDGDLTVTLSSSHPGRATVTTTVVLPDGEATTPLTVTLLDNLLMDGPQVVTISAAAPGFVTATATLTITSDEAFTVTGRIFQDADRNGIFDTEESGLANRTVYLDANNNQQPDPGEPDATTTISGTYTLIAYVAGEFQWRIVPFGWVQTNPDPTPFTVATTGTLELDPIGFDGTFTFTPLMVRP